MSATLTVETDKLVEAAHSTAKRMAATAEGKPETTAFNLPMNSFKGVAGMLEQLSARIAAQQQLLAARTAALDRIAHLEIRGATELLELRAWRRIADELQAIAQDAIGEPRAPRRPRG